MSLGKRLLTTGGAATCLTEDVNPFTGESADGGVALYSLDYDASEASGSYDGTPTDVTFGVSGKTLYGARFNGTSSGIQLPENTTITPANDFTYSLWFKAAGTGFQTLFSSLGNTIPKYGVFLNHTSDSSQSIRFFYSKGSNSQGTVSSSGSVWSTGQWYHLVITKSSTAGLKGYLNTSEILSDATLTDDLTPYTAQNGNTNLGVYQYQGSGGKLYYYDGDLDQVRIFSKVLSTDEISTLWNSGNGETACVHTATANTADFPSGATAVAHYPLDNNSNDNKSTNDGTDTSGVEYRFGRYGQAAVFDGASHIDVDSLTSVFGGKNTVSLSLWFNTTTTARERIFSDYAQTSRNIDITIDGGNIDIVTDYGSATAINFISSADYNDGNWHHIVVAINQSTTQRTIYIDNQLLETATLPTPSWDGYDQHVTIGGIYAGGYGQFFNGKIDQVRVYSSAITSLQVTELYNEKPETDTSNFKTTLYSGDNVTTGNYVSNVGFQPDLVWIKPTSTSGRHLIHNVITGPSVYEGAGRTFHSNETFVSNTYGEFTSFEANGFIVQFSSGSQYFNNSGRDYVAWNWKAGGEAITGSGSNLTSISRSTNTEAGFSIVQYTSTGTSGAFFAHGLSSTPDIVIIKDIANSSNWITTITNVVSDKYLYLNNNGTGGTGGFAVDGTNVTLNNTFSDANTNTRTYVAWCWHSVASYSKIGTYEGNGNTATTTITTGFEPSWVMIKRVDSANNWVIFDNKRDTTSPLSKILYADLADGDTEGGTTTSITISSTGFSMSTSQFGGSINTDGGQYFYMAFK